VAKGGREELFGATDLAAVSHRYRVFAVTRLKHAQIDGVRAPLHSYVRPTLEYLSRRRGARGHAC